MSAHEHPTAVGGKLLTRPMMVMLALFGACVLVILYRLVAGVGAVSAMTDTFAWGIWEPVNVVVFTGIGAGAFGVGLLTYLLNRGEYHWLVRPAVLVGAIAYTLGGTSVVLGLGRYWNAIVLPVVPFWNLASVLLEVAVCVMVYLCVLWVEVLPAVFERAAAAERPWLSRLGVRWGRRLEKAMPYIIALAILLPTMHQSSLGGLMLIAESKVHPLWHSALLPLLFLVTCLSMGYGTVVALVTMMKVAWNARYDRELLARLSKVNAGLIFAYVALRLADIAWSGKLHHLGVNGYTLLFLLEMALFLAPAIMFFTPSVQRNQGRMLAAALLAIAAGSLYRVDTYLTVFRPAPDSVYFPSLGETTVTVGMAAIGVALFLLVARLFPVVVVQARGKPAQRTPPVRIAAGR